MEDFGGNGYLALGGWHNYREWLEDGRVVGCCPGTPEGLNFSEQGGTLLCCVLPGIGANQNREAFD